MWGDRGMVEMSKSKQVLRWPDMRLAAGIMLVCALAACKKDSAAEQAAPQLDTIVTIGFTSEGLAALGIAPSTLDAFPRAFREGPHHPERAAHNGDVGPSAPRPPRSTPSVRSVCSSSARCLST